MKAGVIGCGRMGAEPKTRLENKIPAGWLPMSHVESLLCINEIKEISLCDSQEKQLRSMGEYYNIQSIFINYREMIDQISPDILTIATRTPIKAEIIKYACQKGVKGIYVEKPISNNMEVCKEILRFAKEKNTKILYGVNRRYHAVYRYAKELIVSGKIGEILEIVVEHGPAQLLWSHPHSVDLLLYFSNSNEISGIQSNIVPDSLNREKDQIINSDPVIENAIFKFSNGITGYINQTNGLNLRLNGSKGHIIVHGDGSYIQLFQKTSEDSPYFLDHSIIHPVTPKSATVTAMSEMVMSIKENITLPISVNEIEMGMQMLLGCVWSHLHGSTRIHPSEIPDNLTVTGQYNGLYA